MDKDYKPQLRKDMEGVRPDEDVIYHVLYVVVWEGNPESLEERAFVKYKDALEVFQKMENSTARIERIAAKITIKTITRK